MPNTEVMQSALNVISASAVFDGNELPVFLRVAEHEGAIYLDLADECWRAAKIDSEGWQIVESENVPVRFIRKRGMLPILVPVSGGTIDELYRFVNLPDVDDQILFVGWLLAALRPSGPFPVLAVNGEQGSAEVGGSLPSRQHHDPGIQGETTVTTVTRGKTRPKFHRRGGTYQ